MENDELITSIVVLLVIIILLVASITFVLSQEKIKAKMYCNNYCDKIDNCSLQHVDCDYKGEYTCIYYVNDALKEHKYQSNNKTNEKNINIKVTIKQM